MGLLRLSLRALGFLVPWRQLAALADGGAGNVWLETFLRDGFHVVPNVLSAEQLRRAKRALKDRWLQDRHEGGTFGKERQYALLELDPVFAEFLEAIPESIEKLIGSMIGPWIVGAFDIYKFHPVKWSVPERVRIQEKAFSLHSDYPYGHHPGETGLKAVPSNYPHTMQLIFMVDGFTADNGGTIMLPGSYRGRRLPQGLEDRLRILNQTRTVTGRAGDMIIYIGQTWHGNDLNVADGPRVGVIAQCLPWFYKPMQSFMYTTPYSVERRLSQKVRARLGLKSSHWFHHTCTMGYDSFWRKMYHITSFLWDVLYYGYTTPWRYALFRQLALLALQTPLILFLAVRMEAARLFFAILVGLGLCFPLTRGSATEHVWSQSPVRHNIKFMLQ